MSRKLRVLIACECSGAVREAFRRRGLEAKRDRLKAAVEKVEAAIASYAPADPIENAS